MAKPSLDRIGQDLMDMVKGMHEALKNVERVDKLVFPMLHLKHPTLNPPDFKKN